MQAVLKLREFIRHNLIFFFFLEMAIGLTAIVLPLKIALILMLGLPGILVLLIRPFYAYLLGIFLLPFWTITLTGGSAVAGQVDIRLADVAFLLAAIGLLIKMVLHKDFRLRGSPLDLPIILLFTWMAISFLWATSFSASLVDYLKKVEGLVIFYLTINFVRERKNLNTILMAWIVTGFFTALLGIYELATTGLKFAEPMTGTTITHWGEPVRTSVFAEGPNKLAFALGISLLIAFACYGINYKPWIKKFIFFAIILMFVVLISTLSRIGWIAFFLSLLFLFVVAPKIRMPIITLALIGILAFFLISTTAYIDVIYQRFVGVVSPFQTQDFSGRTEVWGLGLKMFSERPLIGVGVGSFHQLAMASGVTNLQAPHNLFIYVLSEFGIVGAGLFIYLIINLISDAIRGLKKITNEREKVIFLGLMSAMILYFLQGMVTSFRLRENNMWAVLALIFAAIQVFSSKQVLTLKNDSTET